MKPELGPNVQRRGGILDDSVRLTQLVTLDESLLGSHFHHMSNGENYSESSPF